MKSYIKSQLKETNMLLVTGDVILVSIAFVLAVLTSQLFQNELFQLAAYPTAISLFISPVIFYIFELYNHERWNYSIRLFSYICAASVIASAIVGILSYFFVSPVVINRTVLIPYSIFTMIFIFIWRNIFKKISSRIEKLRGKILFIGNSPIMNDIISTIRQTNEIPSDNYLVIRNYSENPGKVYINGSKTGISLLKLVMDDQYRTVVVSDSFSNFPVLKKQLLALRVEGIKIYDAPYFYEELNGKVPIHYINDSWFLFRHQGMTFNPVLNRRIKKLLDKVLSLFALIIAFPLMLLIALAIKVSSRGPVFFKQVRLGRNEKPFTLFKFRSMVDNAEKETGDVWSSPNDPRTTKIGLFLRKTHLDELPQIFNVLKGDMSFVGPRPIRRVHADMLAKEVPYYKFRFTVKPGLSGWGQVNAHYAYTNKEQAKKWEYDFYYIQNQSVFFDLFIIVKTIQTVLFGKGQNRYYHSR
ncbi:MAG: sugar transferase [Nitrospiraceae bacterium]|nr:MAG: sugar transferase [Nitrospiraceae bacterium]